MLEICDYVMGQPFSQLLKPEDNKFEVHSENNKASFTNSLIFILYIHVFCKKAALKGRAKYMVLSATCGLFTNIHCPAVEWSCECSPPLCARAWYLEVTRWQCFMTAQLQGYCDDSVIWQPYFRVTLMTVWYGRPTSGLLWWKCFMTALLQGYSDNSVL